MGLRPGSGFAHKHWGGDHRTLNSIGILMKYPKFGGACFAVTIFLLIAACAAARTFDCRNADEYRFVVVGNPNQQNASDPVFPEGLNIVVGDKVISTIELPKGVNNFSLNSTRKTKAGFEIKADWGGGVNHYEIQFNFRCKDNHLYLYEVKKVSFSTTKPDSGNFLDKKETKVTKIKPNLPIEKFVMIDYL